MGRKPKVPKKDVLSCIYSSSSSDDESSCENENIPVIHPVENLFKTKHDVSVVPLPQNLENDCSSALVIEKSSSLPPNVEKTNVSSLVLENSSSLTNLIKTSKDCPLDGMNEGNNCWNSNSASLTEISSAQSTNTKRPRTEKYQTSTSKSKRSKKLEFYVKGGTKNDSETIKDIEWKISFCCFRCQCPSDLVAQVKDPETNGFLQAGEGMYYHRRCCHRALTWTNKWKSPLEKAFRRAEPTEDNFTLFDNESVETEQATWVEIVERYKLEKRLQSKLFNDDSLAGQDSILNSNESYCKNRRDFLRHSKRKAPRAAVVLDMFGGIGSAIVALKRNSIAISLIIHVEHDMIANHVYKWNHSLKYRSKIDKSLVPIKGYQIDHIYYSRFEDFVEDFNKGKVTNIDIVVGAPPVADFSGINPNREGIIGSQGIYMIEFGNLIQRIQQKQKNPVYFLASNTVIRNQKFMAEEVGDLEQIKSEFGISWSYEFEASDVSPCRRKSTFFSNIPFEFTEVQNGDYASAMSCIEDGYKHCALFFEGDFCAKVNKFMANEKDNEKRMLVFKVDQTSVHAEGKRAKYVRRSLRMSEREKMMGFKPGYISEPVKHLFQTILLDGFGDGRFCEPHKRKHKHWRYLLPKAYQKLSGNYHNFYEDEHDKAYQFKATPGKPVALKMAPPQTGSAIQSLTEEEYARRLIGNAFCIPVLEKLLCPLKKIFATAHYDDAAYEYEWQKETCLVKQE